MNWIGMYTLLAKEVWRFMKVFTQTVVTPVVTVLLYLVVFGSVLSEHVQVYPGVSYSAFLVPGLISMAVLQNAFANTSSSLFQSRQNGNILFMLLAPLSSLEFYLAFTGAAIARGLMVGAGVWIVAICFVPLPMHSFWLILLFASLGSGILGVFGLIAAIVSERWDHVAAFQNFVILPLTFLSGVFYSVHNLPSVWPQVSLYNPFFYLIDGFRYGFLGVSDASIWFSLAVTAIFFIAVSTACLWMLKTGYKLKG
jgi:ABC-2 type transport system permease protein